MPGTHVLSLCEGSLYRFVMIRELRISYSQKSKYARCKPKVSNVFQVLLYVLARLNEGRYLYQQFTKAVLTRRSAELTESQDVPPLAPSSVLFGLLFLSSWPVRK